MDFMHDRTLDEALKGFDNAKNSLKNKDEVFNPERYQAKEEHKTGGSMDNLLNRHIVEDKSIKDYEFLQYIANEYSKSGKVPNTNQIKRDLGKSSDTIKEIFARNTHYFERRNGLPTIVKNEFLHEYNLYDMQGKGANNTEVSIKVS